MHSTHVRSKKGEGWRAACGIIICLAKSRPPWRACRQCLPSFKMVNSLTTHHSCPPPLKNENIALWRRNTKRTINVCVYWINTIDVISFFAEMWILIRRHKYHDFLHKVFAAAQIELLDKQKTNMSLFTNMYFYCGWGECSDVWKFSFGPRTERPSAGWLTFILRRASPLFPRHPPPSPPNLHNGE